MRTLSLLLCIVAFAVLQGCEVLAFTETVSDGRWKVSYRVVSKDGHPITGNVSFTVKAPASARAGTTPTASPSPTKSVAAPATAGGSKSSKPGIYAGIAFAAMLLPLAYVGIRSRRQRAAAR